ncbi:CRISPR-associated protein, Csh2 family [Clostridium sp. USBA 49]|uniref:type I-B CRISPR-associated protein Cas7/Csh2 n=1 Tax=Clostridium sp. USBA 49 TaxID=1881060 RepID=UPI00099A1D33|nr:type I-B CRISPR-associated protein Cas7/Csh2 [Clostridium sp. USBA 49]SKA90401.1 CRISPR-associated protein, Csh2 family [Clostridium sp. USBA 49]
MNRAELIFLYDIKDNNPNGDPLDSNKPRIDEETGINFVTDVRLKRTIRDFIYEYRGKEIFVIEKRTEKGDVQDAKARAKDFGENKNKVIENVLENCVDVRLFGATIPLEFGKEKGSATFTGPVQFNMGRSLHRVALKRIKGTGAFASGEGKDNKTFREEYILPYSLIGFYGIINEHAAKETNLKEEDIKLLLDGIWNGTKNLISRSKVGQTPRLLLKVNYKEGSFHIGDLLKNIKLETKLNDEEEIRGVEDFTLNIDKLVASLIKFKDKIQSIEYLVDDSIMFSIGGKIVKLEDALKEFSPIELKIEG